MSKENAHAMKRLLALFAAFGLVLALTLSSGVEPVFATDTDGDGLSYYLEDQVFGTLVLVADSDGDNLSDFDEIYTYADIVLGLPIVYSPDGYPYFFKDTDGDGIADPGEVNFGNRYTAFDDRLLAAAFNYHSGLDPCGPIHNHRYVIQTLYDSADDLDDGLLNGSVLGNRP